MQTAQARPAARRHPALALLLSLLMPGLGQIYNTRLARGLAILGIAVGLLAAGNVVQLVPPNDLVLAAAPWAFVLVALFYLFIHVDALLGALRAGAVELAWYNRLWVYVAGFVAWAVVAAASTGHQSWSSPSGSMLPTLVTGDSFVAWSRYYAAHEPRRGDIAIYELPPHEGTVFIKRLVGVPGDRIQIVDGVLHINGESVNRERVEDFVEHDPTGAEMRTAQYRETLPTGRDYLIIERLGDTGPLDNTSEYTLPEGHYFALGDDRDNSFDSRGHGGGSSWFVPAANLMGYPIFIYWSGGWPWSEESGRVNWRRLGRQVQP